MDRIREVNPARAGMILRGSVRAELLGRKPRASGDDPVRAAVSDVID